MGLPVPAPVLAADGQAAAVPGPPRALQGNAGYGRLLSRGRVKLHSL